MKLFKPVLVIFFLANIFLYAQNDYINHKIVKGETLTQICDKYNVNSQEVLKLNPDAASGLKEGAFLIIPKLAPSKKTSTNENETQQGSSKTHQVADKETLFSLSKKYNTSVDELIRLNPELKDGLKSGQTIIVTASKVEPPKKESASKSNESNQKENAKPEPSNNALYVVKSGDTKFSLAKKFGLTVEELENLNPEIKNGLPVDFKLITKKGPAKTKEPESQKIETQKTEASKVETSKSETSKPEKLDLGKNQLVVKKGMTLFSIAQDHQTTIEELTKINPALKDGLKEDMVINLPTSSKTSSKKELSNTSLSYAVSKRIAILVPFNQVDKTKLEAQLSKDKFLNMVADYYLGTKIAIDSAKTKKIAHQVEYLDSKETATSSGVDELFNSGKLNNFDIIIGCFYPANNDRLVDLLKDKPTIIISPIRHQETSYPTLVETMMSRNELYSELLNYYKKPNHQLISLIDSKKSLTLAFFQAQNNLSTFKMEDKDQFKSEGLMAALDQSKTNIIFFESESLNFLNKINQLATALKIEGYTIQLVALDFNSTHEADYVFSDFVKNELVYVSTYDNRDTEKTKIFDNNYRKKFKGMANQFVFRGFDIAYDTFERAAKSTQFLNTFDKSSERLNTSFSYAQTDEKGFKNKAFYLLQLKNNSILKIN
jgi:LysM repeat protein